MRFPVKGRSSSPIDVRQVLMAALASALEDGKHVKDEKKGLTGVRSVATGAALVTAGRAAYKGSQLIRERLQGDGQESDQEYEDEDYEEEPEAEAEEDFQDEEPEAEAEEDFEEEEPEAEADEEAEAEEGEPEAEEDEQPEAEADEDFEDE